MAEEKLPIGKARDIVILLRGNDSDRPDYRIAFESLRKEFEMNGVPYSFAAPCGVIIAALPSVTALDLCSRPYVEAVHFF